jgi:hypothetical protein
VPIAYALFIAAESGRSRSNARFAKALAGVACGAVRGAGLTHAESAVRIQKAGRTNADLMFPEADK